MKMFRTMARLELINIFRINEIRHSKNPQEKKRSRMLIFTIAVVAVILIGYAAGGAYALTTLGLTDKIPMLYSMLAVLLQLAMGLIKAKSMLYREKDLDMISSLPVRGIHVIGARILRMYLEGVIITLGALVPAMVIYGTRSGAGAAFYCMIPLACIVLPVLPTALSAWIGILIAAVISKSRHKVLAEIVITVVLFLGMYLCMSLISTKSSTEVSENKSSVSTENTADTELSEEEMKAKLGESVRSALDSMESAFPPARLLGNVLAEPDFAGLLIYAAGSLILLILTVLVIGRLFFTISGKLITVTKHREYQMESLRTQSVMMALVKKELARYTSTGVYVANTIIGPVLAVAFAVATAFVDPAKILSTAKLPFDMDFSAMIPYLVGVFFVMVSISSSSLSMEGKNWWIPKSLPLSAKDILGSKILFNLIFLAPFYALTEIILLFTLRVSFLDRIWLLIIPGVAILYSVLLGMTLNLRFPKFRWENATEVVKQSASSGLSIVGGIVLILPGFGAMILPELYRNLVNLAVVILIGVVCRIMYRKICGTKLERLEG